MDKQALRIEDVLFIDGELDLVILPDTDWTSYFCHLDSGNFVAYRDPRMSIAVVTIPITTATSVKTDGTPNALFFDIYNDKQLALRCCAPEPATSRRWIEAIRALCVPPPEISMDDFSILGVIGRGSLGKVLLAKHKVTTEHVALKSISKRSLLESGRHRAVLVERNILLLLQNPFIVQMKFALQTSSKFYLGVEYAPGGTLADAIERMGTIPLLDARLILAEIAVTLAHLHSVGVIFRGLNPQSILFDREGHIKLSDFGHSKAFADPQAIQTSSFCGDNRYVAPEMVAGQLYSTGVDWWALGVVFCEMLQGFSPFESPTHVGLLNNIAEKQPTILPTVDPEALPVIRALLAKNPAQRLGFQGLATTALFAGFDWEYVAEKRYQPRCVPRIDAVRIDTAPELDLELADPMGKDLLRIDGFEYTAPVNTWDDPDQIALDLNLVDKGVITEAA